MKILICSVSSALGGMERRIEAETRLLTALGHEVLVASPWFPALEQWKLDIEKAGGRYIVWRPYKFWERMHLAAPFRWLSLATLPILRREKIDVAHIAMPWNFVGMSMAHVLSKANIPFVVGVHGKFGKKVLAPRERLLLSRSTRKMIGGYAVSQPVNESFTSLYSGLLPEAAGINTIQNGIDITRFKPNPDARATVRQRLGFDSQHFVLNFCGRLDAMKRPMFALEVFAQLATSAPQSRFLVVGDGAEAASMKAEVAALGLADKVRFVGQVPDTATYYAASDCYLSTSRSNEEGCPLATAEALASGLPAVVPKDDIFSAVYGACGAVQQCAPGTPDHWTRALTSVASQDPIALQQLSSMAQQFVREHLSTEIMNRRLTDFYTSVFAQAGLGAPEISA